MFSKLLQTAMRRYRSVAWQDRSTFLQASYVFADFARMPKELLMEAVKILEQQRKAKLFKGTSADDIGIKFFA
jgi:hypothetical protein